MIFAEVASRVGLLGKVNLPRESRADGRAGGREGRGRKRKGVGKGATLYSGWRARGEKSRRVKITTLPFSFRS